MGSPAITSAGLASVGSKLIIVVVTAVALVSGHSRLALALALAVALQRPGASRITGTVDAVAVLPHVEVLLAALAVGAVAVLPAVQTVTTMTRQVEKMGIEEALVRQTVAVTSWKVLIHLYIKNCMCIFRFLSVQFIRYQFGPGGPIRLVSRLSSLDQPWTEARRVGNKTAGKKGTNMTDGPSGLTLYKL